MISTKFLIRRISLQCSHTNFQKNLSLPKWQPFCIFRKNSKTQKCLYLENRARYSRLHRLWLPQRYKAKAEHFLNTLALTFISFSGCFVCAKTYFFFFASDPLVDPRGCNVKPTCRKLWAGNRFMWSHLALDASYKVKRWFTGFGELSFRWIQIYIGSPMRRSSMR